MFLPGARNLTPVNFIAAHFVAAFGFVLSAAILLLTVANDLTGHYFQPHVLSITHLAALGWVTMVIFGVSYQVIPVLADKPLYSLKIAVATFVLLLCGTGMLAFSFWHFRLDYVAITGGICLLLSFLLYTCNMYQTWDSDSRHEHAKDFIFMALAWLVLTGVFGLVLLLNFRFAFLAVSHLEMLKLHCHFGFGGWFMLLIMGVAAKLLPMFTLSEVNDRTSLRLSLYCINAGLLILVAMIINGSHAWIMLPALLMALGVVLYLRFVYLVIKHRLRKILDEGLKKSKLAFVLLSVPVTCGLVLSADLLPGMNRTATSLSVFYGFSYLFGFITMLVMAQTFKTLPFLIWSKHYAATGTAPSHVLPKDLYSEKLLKFQFVLFIASYALFCLGFIGAQAAVLRAGALLFIAAVTCYGINLLKLIFKHGRRKRETVLN